MALAIDTSTPAIAVQTNNTIATVTTASFTPPSGATLLVRWAWNTVSGGTPSQPTITDNLGSPLTYNLIDWSSRADSPACNGQAASWWAKVSTGAAMTITVTAVNAGLQGGALHVTVLTGAAASPVGAHGKSASTSASSIAQNYTAQATGGWGFIVASDWDLIGAESAGTGCTLTDGGSANAGSEITYGFVRRTSADDSNGATNTLNVTIPGTTTNLHWTYVEILPGASGDRSPAWSPGFATAQTFPRFMVSTPQLGWHSPPYDVGASSGPFAYQQTFTATLSFTGADTVKTATGRTATLGFTSADLFRTAKALAGSVSFTGAESARTNKVQTATVSFTGARSTRVAKGQTAIVGFTSAANARTGKLLPAATISFTSSLVLRTARLLAATLSFVGTLTSQAVHFFTQSLSATIGFTSSLTRVARPALSATLSFIGSLARSTRAVRAAQLSFTGAQTRRVASGQTAQLSFTTSLARRVAHALTATVSFAGNLSVVRLIKQVLSATVGFTGALIALHTFGKVLTATVGFTTTLTRRSGKIFTATTNFTSSQTLRIATRLTSAVGFTVNLVVTPTLLSALSNLRKRIFGSEPGNAVGREPAAGVSGHESDAASGRESPRGVSYNRNDGPIGGREDGTP